MNEKHRPIYQATDEDKAFNERIKAELENGDIPKGPQPEVHINAPVVSSVGEKALATSIDNSGVALKEALNPVDTRGWTSTGTETGTTKLDSNAYVQALGREDLGGQDGMMRASGALAGMSEQQLSNLRQNPQIAPNASVASQDRQL